MFSYLTTTFTTATGVQISVGNTTKRLSPSLFSPHQHFTSKPRPSTAIRAVISSSASGNYCILPEENSVTKDDDDNEEEEYPSGEFEFRKPGAWDTFAVKLRMLIAFPWERVCKGSVLELDLRGQISDQVKSSFSSGLSLPQICENLIKAAYDPRISGVYLQFETLDCGWGILEEIRRHILDFRKSGKFVVGYATEWHEKEYYLGCACDELYAPPSAYFSLYGLSLQTQFYGGVLEKVGVEPQVQRIGKYKSYGDQLTRKNISEEEREVLTTLLDNVYGNWVDKISQAKGKKKEEIESLINEGIYQIEKMKEDGWITDIKYGDEVTSIMKRKMGISLDKILHVVGYNKYSRVMKWTLGLSGGDDEIAVIRASGDISRVRGPFGFSNSGIIAEQFIEKIRAARESRYKAVIIRIDSPGGKVNLEKLYERIGFNKEIISKGRFAELYAADQRPFRPDEENLFAESAENAYKKFRDKAAYSRSMSVDEMEEIAQGRVWTGNDAASRGLVDAIGGFSRAVAIAKQKANIPQDKKVTLVELTQSSPSLPEILSSIANSVIGLDTTLKQLQESVTSSGGVQALMDEIMF